MTENPIREYRDAFASKVESTFQQAVIEVVQEFRALDEHDRRMAPDEVLATIAVEAAARVFCRGTTTGAVVTEIPVNCPECGERHSWCQRAEVDRLKAALDEMRRRLDAAVAGHPAEEVRA